MSQLLSIVDDKLVVEKMNLKYLEGNVMHVGKMDIKGGLNVVQNVVFDDNLKVRGTIEVDTLKVKNILKDETTQLDAFTFTAETENQLENKGLVWGLNDNATYFQFVLRNEPRRIYSSESLDLKHNAHYQIDGMDVLSKDTLGSVIRNSSLTTLGVLEGLEVDGNTNLGNTIIVNSYLNRVGINTEKPNAALSIVEDSVEVAIGSRDLRAFIGTWSNQPLDIITDNTTRISIHGNHVTFGSEKGKNAVVKINGTLEVDSIVSDVRVERTAPIEFLEDNDGGTYGKGLVWKAKNTPSKQFFLMPSPDRFYSTETIDLARDKAFTIGRQLVLDSYTLGDTVKNSSLETLGTLSGLSVGGNVNLSDAIWVNDNTAGANRSFTITTADVSLRLTSDSLQASDSLRVVVKDTQEFAISENNITLGNKDNTARTINAYGKLAVNITHPDPEAAFSVEGPVVMSGKKFVNAASMPNSGQWTVGDIAWNITPQSGSYIGWVCVTSGTPGVWKPFGQIA